ncbi:MAG: hypothetical protein ABIY55_35065, partial [Kofleriaceae bacterium]
INIVVHANEDGGMSMKFDQDSKTNIDQPELQAKVDKGQVTALPDTIVDHGTNVNVHGCALGRNQAMLKTLSAAIGGTDKEAPTVYGTKDLQAYGHTGNAHEEFLAEYWTVGYPAKAPIKGKPLADAFRAQYASVTGIDWDKEAPKGEKKHRGYDGVADLGHMIIPPQTSKAGHTALLKAVGKGQDWDSWSVLEQTTTVVGDKDKTTFKYQYKKGDETGTQSFSIENTRVPKTKVEQDAYVKAELGADFDLYSWTYKLVDQVGAVGDTVTATFTYTGAREFVRVKRILEDAQHNKLDPPRTDAAHYGHYTPPQPAPAVP